MSAHPHPLADKALAKLHRLAEGNGLSPADITLIGAEEQGIAFRAEMLLTLETSLEKKRYPGFARAARRGGEATQLSSQKEMDSARAGFETQISESSRWINETVAQLKEAPGNGFGMMAADITLDGMARVFSASETCTSCQGSGTAPCTVCQSTGYVTCKHCQGTGQELCPTCNGRGTDPQSPHEHKYCPTCAGATYINCRFCLGRRQVTCPACNGRGRTSCAVCGGHGKFTLEQRVLPTVRAEFRPLESAELPSGLRRALDRGGFKLLNRLAKITVGTAEDLGNKKARLAYEAQFPYAEARARLAGKAARITVIGEKAVLRDVPPFLDAPMEAALDNAKATLDKALKLRAMGDLLAVLLSGRELMDFMRQYPMGLSGQVVTRMREHVLRLVQERTLLARAGASCFCLAVLGGIYYALLASHLRAGFAAMLFPAAAYLFDAFVCGLSLLGLDMALRFAAASHMRSLTRPGEKVALSGQRTGVLGLCVGACALFLYLAMLWFLGAVTR